MKCSWKMASVFRIMRYKQIQNDAFVRKHLEYVRLFIYSTFPKIIKLFNRPQTETYIIQKRNEKKNN